MPRLPTVTDDQVPEIRAELAKPGGSVRKVAAARNVSPGAIQRALKRSGKTRQSDEFEQVVAKFVAPPRRQAPVHSWSLESIRVARQAQMEGDFKSAVRLAEAFRTESALFAAYHNRIAPQSALAFDLKARPTARGKAIKSRAESCTLISRTTLLGIHGTLANHGVAIGRVRHEPDQYGTSVGFELEEWPLEHVKHNRSTEALETAVDGGSRVPVTHGDGHWIVFRKTRVLPWTQDACVLPAALLWAALANGTRDWASAGTSHGQAKIVGELPEGFSVKDKDGNLTTDAKAFLDMLAEIVSGEVGAAIRPAGSKTEFVANNSTAWQIFKEFALDRGKAAARIYLGTDATLGSVGGAPGVDIATLFGVATTRLQGDLQAIEDGLNSGFYAPWTAINFGDSSNAPRGEYQIPDPDADAKHKEYSDGLDRLFQALDNMRRNSMKIDQDVINTLSGRFGVEAPQLTESGQETVQLDLAPTDVAKVVKGREARRSRGLGPFGDARDDLTIAELDAQRTAPATPPAPVDTPANANADTPEV